MNIKRTIIASLCSIAFAGAGIASMPAHASAAAGDLCKIRIVSIKALDLQEDAQGQDEIFMRLGDTSTTQRNYFEGQKRNTLQDGDDFFVDEERVRLVEKDAGASQVVDRANVQCDDDSGESVLSDGDAIYEVSWLVTVEN